MADQIKLYVCIYLNDCYLTGESAHLLLIADQIRPIQGQSKRPGVLNEAYWRGEEK